MVAHYKGDGNGDCGVDNNWICEQVDQTHGEQKGLYTSIDISPDTNPEPIINNWKVGVSYYDASYKILKYAQYSCSLLSGCAWTTEIVENSPDTYDDYGKWSSLKFGSTGIPNISYHFFNDTSFLDFYGVRYASRVGGGNGNCGDYNNWDCSTVDSNLGVTGQYTSLDIDYSGNVFVAYYDASNSDLKYAYYAGIGDCGTGNAWICQTIETSSNDVGKYVSFHAPQSASDTIKAAYYDSTAGKLKYAYDTIGTGNCGPGNGWQCLEIDDMGAGLILADISLAVGPDNQPLIAYTDASEDLGPSRLKVAVPAYFSPLANCGGQMLYDWYCQAIDNGGAYTSEANYVAAGVKDNGLAMIAYSEWDSYYDGYNLKVAFQVGKLFLPLIRN